MAAAKKNRHDTMTVLLEEGMAVVDKVDKQGHTALHYAVQSDNVEATEVLLSHGANVNARDYVRIPRLPFFAIHSDPCVAVFRGNVDTDSGTLASRSALPVDIIITTTVL